MGVAHKGRMLCRTLRQVESTAEMVRLVGLSATLPNYRDVGTLLRVKPDHCFFFNAAYRPCPLAQTFIGVTIKKPLQRFQLMNEICYKKIMEAAGKHQVLIFVHSRKETAKTARFLRDKATEDEQLNKIMSTDASSREILQVLHLSATPACLPWFHCSRYLHICHLLMHRLRPTVTMCSHQSGCNGFHEPGGDKHECMTGCGHCRAKQRERRTLCSKMWCRMGSPRITLV